MPHTLPSETQICVNNITLIIGGNAVLKVDSPYPNAETAAKLRAAASLIEHIDAGTLEK